MKTLNEQIERLKGLIRKCYGAVAGKNGTVPEVGERNMENLPEAIASTHDTLEELTITANGEYLPQEGVDGFSKVVASVVPKRLVKLKAMQIKDDCIVDGYWAGELVDTSETTSFLDLFRYANSLQQVDVSGWDTRNVTTMANIFVGCSLLQQVDVSGWDTSNVINFDNIFLNCTSLQQVDVSNWDTSNATRMSGTFPRNLQSIIGGRTIDDVLANNIGALNGLKISISFTNINLDRASLRAIINGLADLTGQTAQTLTLGATLMAKLTEEDIAISTSKNWTIV